MSRTYARFYAALANHPKWLDLSWAGKAAWASLFLRGIPTDGRFKSRAHVERILRLEKCPAQRVTQVLEELVNLDLFDELDDGSIVQHDFDDHQPRFRGPSDEPEAAYERAKKSRANAPKKATREEAAVKGWETRRARQPQPSTAHAQRPDGADSSSDSTRHDQNRLDSSRFDRGDSRRGDSRRGDSTQGEERKRPSSEKALSAVPGRARERAFSESPKTRAPNAQALAQPRLTRDALERFEREWVDYLDPAWGPFRQAWIGRGFVRPPIGQATDDPGTSQRTLLWQIADARPDDLGRWVREAKGRTAQEVIDHVLRCWHEARSEAELDAGDAELRAEVERADERDASRGALERLSDALRDKPKPKRGRKPVAVGPGRPTGAARKSAARAAP